MIELMNDCMLGRGTGRTPGETERIIRNLVGQIEKKDDLIKKLKVIVADYRDKETRQKWGFPPRRLI
jgi:hypothetical protein